MNVFIDTAAFLAILNADDRFHQQAENTWNEIIPSQFTLISSNDVILDATALLEHRFGIVT